MSISGDSSIGDFISHQGKHIVDICGGYRKAIVLDVQESVG